VRTTVEIRDELLGRLRQEAVRRGARGFSGIVEEAIERFFAQDPAKQKRVRAALAAKLTRDEADSLDAHVKRVRSEWGKR
jgi:predicted transcriptional regulator